MAEQLGLPGLVIQEAYGGIGCGPLEDGIVLEGMGSALLVAPFFGTAALAAQALVASDDAVLKCGSGRAERRGISPTRAAGGIVPRSADPGGVLVHPVDLALLVLRLAVGVVMLAHGRNHLLGGGRIAGTARWFESLGMRPGWLHAWTASLMELVAGALLVLGLLTPLAGAVVVGVLSVAWVTNHRKNGFFIFRPGEGYEYVMTLVACGLALCGMGGGKVSLDHLFGVFDPPGWSAALVSAGLGVAGAVGLLAVFWRPGAVEQR